MLVKRRRWIFWAAWIPLLIAAPPFNLVLPVLPDPVQLLAPPSLSEDPLFTRALAEGLLRDYREEKDPARRQALARRIIYFVERLNKIKTVLFDIGGVLSTCSSVKVVEIVRASALAFPNIRLDKDKAGAPKDIRPALRRIFFSGKWARQFRESQYPRDVYPHLDKPDLSFPEFVQMANYQLLKALYLDNKWVRAILDFGFMEKLNQWEDEDRIQFIFGVTIAFQILRFVLPAEAFLSEDFIHDALYRAHQVTPGAPELVKALQARGLQTRILSNHFPDSTGQLPDKNKTPSPTDIKYRPNASQFEAIEKAFRPGTFQRKDVYFSNQIGVSKPDRGSFRAVEIAEKLQPDEIAYVDDQEVNVERAAQFGYLASHYAYAEGNPIGENFLLQELAAGEWRRKAFQTLQETALVIDSAI